MKALQIAHLPVIQNGLLGKFPEKNLEINHPKDVFLLEKKSGRLFGRD